MVYTPTIALHPWLTLQEYLDTVGMTQQDFAERVGMDKATVNQIIKWKARITFETAISLERATRIPASMWNNLEALYRADIARIQSLQELEQDKPFLKHFTCYPDLLKLGLVKDTTTPVEKLHAIYSLLGISGSKQFKPVYGNRFRKSFHHDVSEYNLACRLRAGELLSEKIDVRDYNKKALKGAIESLKEMTMQEDTIEVEMVQKHLALAGVRFVIVPHFQKTPVSGVARTAYNQPLVQISTRGKKIDALWFTLFHELWHVYYNHIKQGEYIDIENDRLEDELEQEANDFATTMLFPKSRLYKKLTSDWSYVSRDTILEYAEESNIGVNMVAGHLCHIYRDHPELYKLVSWLRPSLSDDMLVPELERSIFHAKKESNERRYTDKKIPELMKKYSGV